MSGMTMRLMLMMMVGNGAGRRAQRVEHHHLNSQLVVPPFKRLTASW